MGMCTSCILYRPASCGSEAVIVEDPTIQDPPKQFGTSFEILVSHTRGGSALLMLHTVQASVSS